MGASSLLLFFLSLSRLPKGSRILSFECRAGGFSGFDPPSEEAVEGLIMLIGDATRGGGDTGRIAAGDFEPRCLMLEALGDSGGEVAGNL